MDKTTQKRINNLLVRIGDQGTQSYPKNLNKLVQITPTFMQEEESKKMLLECLRECIKKIPHKSYIYACYFSV